jgi:hypothetical protein
MPDRWGPSVKKPLKGGVKNASPTTLTYLGISDEHEIIVLEGH